MESLDAVTRSLRDGRFEKGLEQVRKGEQRRKGTDEHLLRRAAWWEQDRLDLIFSIERMFHCHWLNVGINYLLGNAEISPLMRALIAQLVEKASINELLDISAKHMRLIDGMLPFSACCKVR